MVVAKRAVELGFTSTVGIIHDGDGQLHPQVLGVPVLLDRLAEMEDGRIGRLLNSPAAIAEAMPATSLL